MIEKGIFGWRSALEERFIADYEKLGEIVGHLKGLGYKIVLTSGSFDLIHEGHALYLEKAREFGDILVVGVDSDLKISTRKNRNPVVPEMERVRMLTHLRYVDIVTLKTPEHKHWALIQTVQPNVLIASESTKGGEKGGVSPYSEEETKEILKYCGRIEVLAPQATTSTSARIRLMHVQGAKQVADKITARMNVELPAIIEKSLDEVGNGK